VLERGLEGGKKMIVRFFPQGTGGSSGPINYLFDDAKHLGYRPELVSGNASLTKHVIDGISNKHKYVSKVIAFRQGEVLSQSDQLKLVQDFQKTFAPFKNQERVNFLWVRHMDKGNLELHFVCPRVCLQTGKAFNIHPPGKANQLFFQSWTRLQNLKNGFGQVDGLELSPTQVRNTMDAFQDLYAKRKNYLATGFDKRGKTSHIKKHEPRRTRNPTDPQPHTKLRKLYTGPKFAGATHSTSQPANHADTNAGTANDFAKQGRHEQVSSDLEYRLSASQSLDRQFEFRQRAGEQLGRSKGTTTQAIGLSVEEEIRSVAMQLNDCNQGQAGVLIARLNVLQGQRDRLRPKLK
jgi:Relaxase/Mobilisation nuclease domain